MIQNDFLGGVEGNNINTIPPRTHETTCRSHVFRKYNLERARGGEFSGKKGIPVKLYSSDAHVQLRNGHVCIIRKSEVFTFLCDGGFSNTCLFVIIEQGEENVKSQTRAYLDWLLEQQHWFLIKYWQGLNADTSSDPRCVHVIRKYLSKFTEFRVSAVTRIQQQSKMFNQCSINQAKLGNHFNIFKTKCKHYSRVLCRDSSFPNITPII